MRILGAFLLFVLSGSVAFAAGTVKIDESRYDMANKRTVEKDTKVFHPIAKSFSVRTVYQVTELPTPQNLKSVYIVRETTKVTKTIKEDAESYVIVTPNNSANWQYQVK
jgi:hypothetical protein